MTDTSLQDPNALATLALDRLYFEAELDPYLAGYYESLLDSRRSPFARAHNLARWSTAYEYCMHAYSGNNQPRVLDFGCGVGTHSLALAASGMTVLGVDLSTEAIQSARRRADEWMEADLITAEPEFRVGSGVAAGIADGQFDVVLFHESLAHVGERSTLWKAVEGLLRPGGLVVIAESNALNPAVRLGNRRRRTAGQVGVQDPRYVHKSLRSAKNLRRELGSVGIQVVANRYFGFSPSAVWRRSTVMARALDRVASRTPGIRQMAVSYTLMGRRQQCASH